MDFEFQIANFKLKDPLKNLNWKYKKEISNLKRRFQCLWIYSICNFQYIGGGKMNQEQMKNRTKDFAKKVISLCRQLPPTREGRLVGGQFFRSGTSVGANYRAACRARSKADFISKLSIVLEETDE